MKKLTLALLVVAGMMSCDKKEDPPATTTPATYTCPTCVTAPEAKAEHDGGSGGVYKGVLVGSTGTIAMYLYNSGTDVKALIIFDGKNATLTTTSLSAWQPGQAITNALFTGTVDGKAVQATFSVGANGQNPVLSVLITGHQIVASVFKETSTSLVKNYEGTYAGADSGTFNMAFHGTEYSIVSSGGGLPMTGMLVNGKIDYFQNSVEIKGEFKGDDVSGTWKDHKDGKTGTWSGKRTL